MALSDQQKAFRRRGYGSSDVATIVGVGPGKLIDVYASKVLPPDESEEDDVLARDLGTLLEEPVACVYAKRTGTFLVPVGSLQSPTKPLALATPDRARFMSAAEREAALGRAQGLGASQPGDELALEQLAGCERLVEIKTTAQRYRKDYGLEGTDDVPEEKLLQVTWQQGVTGVQLADMPVLFRGDWGVELLTFTIPFRETLFEALYEAVERFHHDHVLPQKPPAPDASPHYDAFLARAFPSSNMPPVMASPEQEEMLLAYAKYRQVEKRAGLLKDKLAQQLKTAIGPTEGLLSTRYGKLSYRRTQDGTKVDWQRAANEALALCGLVLNGMQNLHEIDAKPSAESIAELARRLKEIIPAATSVKPGYRVLRSTFAGEAKLEMHRLELALEALGDGTEE